MTCEAMLFYAIVGGALILCALALIVEWIKSRRR